MRCCAHYSRHWFTAYGMVGLRRPNCARCEAPNPRPLTEEEQREWDFALAQGWVRA